MSCMCPSRMLYEKWCCVVSWTLCLHVMLLWKRNCKSSSRNDQLRMQFAEKANELGAFIEEKHTALADLSMQGMGTMEAC